MREGGCPGGLHAPESPLVRWVVSLPRKAGAMPCGAKVRTRRGSRCSFASCGRLGSAIVVSPIGARWDLDVSHGFFEQLAEAGLLGVQWFRVHAVGRRNGCHAPLIVWARGGNGRRRVCQAQKRRRSHDAAFAGAAVGSARSAPRAAPDADRLGCIVRKRGCKL